MITFLLWLFNTTYCFLSIFKRYEEVNKIDGIVFFVTAGFFFSLVSLNKVVMASKWMDKKFDE